jgi:hypothetical protein
MSTTLTSVNSHTFSTIKSYQTPSFKSGQVVYFLGGIGTITDCQPLSGSWIYSIRMPLGHEPVCGRLGAETTVLLPESELYRETIMNEITTQI